MAKTTCPITRAQFRENAEQVVVKVGDSELIADPKEFSTGSLGWYLNSKTTLKVGDKAVTVQIGMNLTIVGSKGLPNDDDGKSESESSASSEEE